MVTAHPIHVALHDVTKSSIPNSVRSRPSVPSISSFARVSSAVVGPSGCGKSTLLDIMAALTPPSSGTVTFEGRPIGNSVPDGVGVVFRENACFPWLNVADNITFGLRRQQIDGAEIERRLQYALQLMGFERFRARISGAASGGMRQRVCIARTLVMQPRLILLDEPFGALDQQTRLLMGDESLRIWRATGATILSITHALDEAAMLATASP